MHAVTGAFGYSGAWIARRLLEAGREVITLTGSPRRDHPLGESVQAHPFHFDAPARLVRTLEGVRVLYNTYWVRFEHAGVGFDDAVRHSRALFRAAREAGVRKIVHVSITNPSLASDLPYFRGKAEVEAALGESGIPHTILRPAVLFGGEDILINNVAWALRRLPVFGVFGDGSYRLRPIHVDDFARLAVREGLQEAGPEADARAGPAPDEAGRAPERAGRAARSRTIEAIGPETFTFRGLVEALARAIGVRRPIVGVPPAVGLAAARLLGWWKGDVLITRHEVRGLMEERLYVDAPPAGWIRFTEWARRRGDELGRSYASELARRRDRRTAYERL